MGPGLAVRRLHGSKKIMLKMIYSGAVLVYRGRSAPWLTPEILIHIFQVTEKPNMWKLVQTYITVTLGCQRIFKIRIYIRIVFKNRRRWKLIFECGKTHRREWGGARERKREWVRASERARARSAVLAISSFTYFCVGNMLPNICVYIWQ